MPNWGQYPILQPSAMIGVVNRFQNTDFFLQNAVFPTRKPIDQPLTEWDVLTWTRKKAGFATYDSPAHRQALMPVDHKTARTARVFLSKELDANTLGWLRDAGQSDEAMKAAERKIAEELEDLNRQCDFLVEWACAQALTGTLTVNQTSAAAPLAQVQFTVDYGMTAALKADVSTDWDESAAVPLSSNAYGFPYWKGLGPQYGGVNFVEMLCNQSVTSILLGNTAVQNALGQGGLKERVAVTGQLGRLAGVDITEYDYGYVTDDADASTFVKFVADNYVVFLPTPENRRYNEIHEASHLIPSPDGTQLVKVPAGKAVYSEISYNPPGVTIYLQYNFLPVLRLKDSWAYVRVKVT